MPTQLILKKPIMKRISFFIFSCLITQVVYSQKLIVDDAINLKKGLYKTFDEFKENAPSIPLEWEIQWGIFNYILSGAGSMSGVHDQMTHNDTLYKLKIDKGKTQEIGTIWGFCDGKCVYINREFSPFSGKVIFKPDSKFYKILYIGRYCYFSCAFPVGVNVQYVHAEIGIDLNSGKLWEINKKQVKKILSRDEELMQQYINDNSNENINFKYLKLFSEKHKDEIER